MGKKQGRIQDISGRLCEEFQRVVPLLPGKVKPGKPLSENEIKAASETALNKFYAAAQRERLHHRLGIIGRARLAFALQQGLLKAGYPSSLVKQVLFAMLASAFVGDKR